MLTQAQHFLPIPHALLEARWEFGEGGISIARRALAVPLTLSLVVFFFDLQHVRSARVRQPPAAAARLNGSECRADRDPALL